MSDFDCPKCGAEHDACGNHEEDHGERECDQCGFKFFVEIEYDPSYSVTCVQHEWVFERCGNNCQGNRCKYCSTIESSSLVFDT